MLRTIEIFPHKINYLASEKQEFSLPSTNCWYRTSCIFHKKSSQSYSSFEWWFSKIIISQWLKAWLLLNYLSLCAELMESFDLNNDLRKLNAHWKKWKNCETFCRFFLTLNTFKKKIESSCWFSMWSCKNSNNFSQLNFFRERIINWNFLCIFVRNKNSSVQNDFLRLWIPSISYMQ